MFAHVLFCAHRPINRRRQLLSRRHFAVSQPYRLNCAFTSLQRIPPRAHHLFACFAGATWHVRSGVRNLAVMILVAGLLASAANDTGIACGPGAACDALVLRVSRERSWSSQEATFIANKVCRWRCLSTNAAVCSYFVVIFRFPFFEHCTVNRGTFSCRTGIAPGTHRPLLT